MLRQSPSRNQRSKGFKLKSVVQICVLVVICIWLLYQVKYFLYNKTYKGSTTISVKVGSGHEIIKLGRKGLRPEVEEGGAKNEEPGEGREDPEEEEEEESRGEEHGDETRGDGDDDMDGRDQDRLEEEEEEEEEEESEQADDFADEEDKDMVEEGSER